MPVFLTTWKFGVDACRVGYTHLASGGTALDAIERAANVTELDPDVHSVGYGGLPNAEGVVELDAAIMDGLGHRAGAVGALRNIRRPISVARRVMEQTPHVFLVGDNALRFAVRQGFPEEEMLTDLSLQRWQEWRQTHAAPEVSHFDEFTPDLESEGERKSFDTIGLCALDNAGNLAVGCTTSGMAWKIPGRVGDSPIIGSGLYVDNEVGGAAATGHGDEMMKANVCYRVVLLMEQGRTPQEAIDETLRYLMRKRPPEQYDDYGAGIIALRKDGQFGAGGTRSGFHAPDRLWNWCVAITPEVDLREGPYVTPSTFLPTLL